MQKPSWFTISFFKDWALWTLSLASGGPTVVIALYFFLQGKDPPRSGLLIVFGTCSLVAAWGAGLQERWRRVQERNKSRPRLIVRPGQLFVDSRDLLVREVNTITESMQTRRIPFCSLNMRIENDPLSSVEDSVARQIGARLTFFNSLGREQFSFEGRWGDTTQPPNLDSNQVTYDLTTVDIPIGMSRELNMVLKYNTDDVAYGFNNDSYGNKMNKRKEWALGNGEYLVRVRLRGINVDQTFQLRFFNPPGTQPLQAISCDEDRTPGL